MVFRCLTCSLAFIALVLPQALASTSHHNTHKTLKAHAAYKRARTARRHVVVDHGPAFRKQQEEAFRARELTRAVRQKDASTRQQQDIMTQAELAKQKEQNFQMWQMESQRAREEALKKKMQ